MALLHGARYRGRVRAIVTIAAHVRRDEVTHGQVLRHAKMVEDGEIPDWMERFHGDRAAHLLRIWAEVWQRAGPGLPRSVLPVTGRPPINPIMPFVPEYPFPRLEYGETLEVAPGVHWIRMPLPFALNHVNLWLLADGDGWTVVDTGYNIDRTKEVWDDVLPKITGGAPVTRVICTHFHPDHMGLAGWFQERFDAPLWMTYTEWLQAHVAESRTLTHDFDRWVEFYRDNGAPAEMTEGFQQIREIFRDPCGASRTARASLSAGADGR